MEKSLCLLILSALIGGNIFAQSSTSNSQTVESILNQKSYHIDLPTFNKAKLAVEMLIEETTLNNQQIKLALDDIVSSPESVHLQVYRKYCGLPVFIDTGNPNLDRKNLNKAKEKWVQENPEKYTKLTESQSPQN